MFAKKPLIKSGRKPSTNAANSNDALSEVALAAIVSYKNEKEIGDFMSFFLDTLKRNSDWLNGVLGNRTNFRCAWMVGAGPNRFQLQEIVYPKGEDDFHLEVEHRGSEDFDKIAIAALLTVASYEIDHLLMYTKTRLNDNPMKDDLVKCKEMGVNFAILRPFYKNQYRLVERIVISSSIKSVVPMSQKKRKPITKLPLKKARRVA